MATESGLDWEREIYQFKVALKGVRPPLWRRFTITDAETLAGGWEEGADEQKVRLKQYIRLSRYQVSPFQEALRQVVSLANRYWLCEIVSWF
ncbi:MAG: hypothetical protein Fur0021_05670 [Candidatus Promineifilaceae bacterium]